MLKTEQSLGGESLSYLDMMERNIQVCHLLTDHHIDYNININIDHIYHIILNIDMFQKEFTIFNDNLNINININIVMFNVPGREQTSQGATDNGGG